MYAELAGTVDMVCPDYNQPSANREICSLTTIPLPTKGKMLSYPPSADREKNRLTIPSQPTEDELPCHPFSADIGISRLTTIPLSTDLVGLLCCTEFQVAASEGAKNVKRICDRHRHVVVLVNAGSRYHCCVMFITGKSSCSPSSRCDHHIVAVVPFWPFDGAIITAGVRGWRTLCMVVVRFV